MRRIIEYFDQTYIINLRDRTDRKAGCIKEFERIGMPAPSGNVKFYTSDRPLEQGSFPSIGSRGSYTSHQRVLELAIEANAQSLLVVEDDILFKSITRQHEDQLLEFLSKGQWDVFYFGYLEPRDTGLKGPIADWTVPTIGGHFYGVNGGFIRTMAAYMQECQGRPQGHPLGGPTFRDGAYNNVRLLNPDLRLYLAVPNLGAQRSSRTDLPKLQFYDRHRLLRPIVNQLRSLKNSLRRLTD